jgi:hypothetical protein
MILLNSYGTHSLKNKVFMHNFIKKQIEKVITGIKKTQSDEKDDSHVYYKQSSFDVSFAKSQSILLVTTDLM